MMKLKKIICHLDDGAYKSIEGTLVKNKAENFLFLFKSYRTNINDNEIIKQLELNSNSFYVLKSRLYDKIQEHLSGDINISKEELVKKLDAVSAMCVNEPREVAMAYLQKLEKDLLKFDMHNELLIVYSALKKINLYSERYFHYSQLFNKHIAFSLSLEKSEEILGNFNRIFGQYDFSRNPKLLETLLFIRKDIADHYALNQSRQVEIIKNFIELQLCLFCNTSLNLETNTEGLLNQTRKIMEELPDSSPYRNWMKALDYFCFEYYFKTGQLKTALEYYIKVDENFKTILLLTNICCTSKFLLSKIAFLQQQGRTEELLDEKAKVTLFDSNDIHSVVIIGIYNSFVSYYSGNYKDATTKLNEVINENSFKDYFHINTDVKLNLAYLYLNLKEYDLADSLIKSIYRKIKTEKIENYNNVLSLIKVFEQEIKQANDKVSEKQKDDFALFCARNKNECELLIHLTHEMKKKYG